MAVCFYCGEIKLSEQSCRRCGQNMNVEDYRAMPPWKRARCQKRAIMILRELEKQRKEKP